MNIRIIADNVKSFFNLFSPIQPWVGKKEFKPTHIIGDKNFLATISL